MPGIVIAEKQSGSFQKSLKEAGNDDNAPAFMAWEDLIFLSDLFLTGGERDIHLLGSDPLDHPDIMDMVAYLLERGCLVSVFTSGKVAEEMLEDAREMDKFLHKDLVNFLCDMTDLAHGRVTEQSYPLVNNFLTTLSNRITPWITLEEPGSSLDGIVSLINKYNLRRVIRVSLRQPGEAPSRSYLEPEQIESAITSLFSQTDLLETFRVKLNFDCGFPPCCFSDEQLAYMVRNVPGFSVSPCIPGVTVGHDMTVWSCRQLPGFSRKPVFDFNSYQEILRFYGEQHFAVRFESSGAFLDCDTCMIREDIICSGGCVAPVLPRFIGEHPYNIAKNPLRRKEVFE
jgi:hypothetical protein